MRVFELTTHVKSISRGKGSSATAAAAYRACCAIDCEREGRSHDYTRKAGLEASAIVLPAAAPSWARDRSKLWNAAELRERNGKRGRNAGAFKADAVTAREFLFSFPCELSEAGRLAVARTLAQHLADTHGIAADFSIHKPGKEGDQRNFHCHMLTTARRLTPKGLAEKAREWDDLKSGASLAKQFRSLVAATITAELVVEKKAGLVKVEHLSFAERGSAQTATQHQGPGRVNAVRRDQGKARAAWLKSERAAPLIRPHKELAALKVRHDLNLAAKHGEWTERERRGIEAIRARHAASEAAAPPAPTGWSRMFLVITGRAMRADFARQAESAARIEAAEKEIAGLKDSIRTERRHFTENQRQERAVVVARHEHDRERLKLALDNRVTIDRAAETAMRRAPVQTQGRGRNRGDRDHGRGLSP